MYVCINKNHLLTNKMKKYFKEKEKNSHVPESLASL